jgi:NADPH:quinone reductase-like Zn-dependent oxidoreductase
LKVEIAPYTPPSRDMIVVKNAAVAINPIDSLIQSRGDIMFTCLKYSFILGCDIAGEVVEWRWARTLVAFKSVIEFWDSEGGTSRDINDSAEGAFQYYSHIRQNFACVIPRSLSYESASVIPLGIATASTGLFGTAQLGPQLPTAPPRPAIGKTLIIDQCWLQCYSA